MGFVGRSTGGRHFITQGKSTDEVKALQKGRDEADAKNAEGMEKYFKKEVKKKVRDKRDNWKKKSEGLSKGDIYNDI